MRDICQAGLRSVNNFQLGEMSLAAGVGSYLSNERSPANMKKPNKKHTRNEGIRRLGMKHKQNAQISFSQTSQNDVTVAMLFDKGRIGHVDRKDDKQRAARAACTSKWKPRR